MRLIDVDNYCEHICRCNKEKCDKGKCPIHNAPTIEAVPVDRNGIIDEFAQKAIERLEDMGCEAWRRDIMAIAEEMKGGAK